MPKPYTEEQFAQKFWGKVDKTSDSSGCWLWMGIKCNGYGRVFWKGKQRMTHHVSYILSGNIIPEGLHLAHSENCIGKSCNPLHLTPKTPKENNADKIRDGTNQSGERHPLVKLTETQVLNIRARNGENQRLLGEEFGVKQITISNILLRKSWKHI